MDPRRERIPGRFYTPYINSRYIFPSLVALAAVSVCIWNGEGVRALLTNTDPAHPELSGWDVLQHRVPLIGFDLAMFFLSIQAFRKSWSLIPLLGLSSCAYLMTELGWINWVRFGIWLGIGLVIYFSYGYRHSKWKGETA